MKIQWKYFAYVYLFSCISLPVSAEVNTTQPIKISTWNLEWLTTSPTNSIKESQRKAQDFNALTMKFGQIKPDILAFQEVDSIAAIHKVVGEDYRIYLSDRAKPQYSNLQFKGVNQYTGFAISEKWLIRNQGKIVDPQDIELLNNAKLRFATYIVIQQANRPDLHLLSVHLKHGCAAKKKRSRSCQQLSDQTDRLNQWLAARVEKQQTFIVLGDFNHNLAYQGDWMWQQLTAKLNEKVQLATQATSAICQVKSNRNPNQLYRYPSLIDHIIVSRPSQVHETQQIAFTKQEALNYHLSDHCPVVSDIDFTSANTI
ncbi:endonuclease/exonuclease/phosphatase family protein [Vibrio rumoiensis]|uniref:endonuclease/exonuclease/phosphatase family protein n=1 Tax=Vibrio rumoiensis TaxID=76258 RepID=UPI003AA9D6F7